MRTVNATEFKAKCLKILDEVAASGESITILKRGRPVASLGPAAGKAERYPQRGLEGTVRTLGDILSPVLPPDAWDAVSRKRR